MSKDASAMTWAGVATGIWRVEVKDTDDYPTTSKTALPPQHRIIQYQMSVVKSVRNTALSERRTEPGRDMQNAHRHTLQASAGYPGFPRVMSPAHPCRGYSFPSDYRPSSYRLSVTHKRQPLLHPLPQAHFRSLLG